MIKILSFFIMGLMLLEVKNIVKNFSGLLRDFKQIPKRNHLEEMYFDVCHQELF